MSQDFATAGSPPMIGKALTIAQWNEYIANYQFGSLPVKHVVLHHTWKPNLQQWGGLRSMQGMQKFYAGKGWYAAPHIYVAPDGIWLFTPISQIGIHAGVGNGSHGQGWYSIGVEMVGDYDRALPTSNVWEQSKAVMAGISRKLGIAPAALIKFHREYSPKSCPGWAITTPWVVAELQAYMASAAPPPAPAPGPIGMPTPEQDEVLEALMDQSYVRRAEGYNSSWAFHNYALKHKIGFPLAKSARVSHGGKQYAYQPFTRDTLFNEVPDWGDVQQLAGKLGGRVPADGSLERALLDATYQTGGAAFRPDWAFHQYAVKDSNLGPPLAPSKVLNVDGKQYSYQVFAGDTIYNPGTEWQNIHRVSALTGATDPPQVKLRDALLAETYKAASQEYKPEWAFHQLARTFKLGAPLGAAQPVTVGAHNYNFQVYAGDTLYNIDQQWSKVLRLSELLGTGSALLSGDDEPQDIGALLGEDADFQQGFDPDALTLYRVPGLFPTAWSGRSGSKVVLIVLHEDPGPAGTALQRMATPGARRMTHYYITAEGQMLQLLDDDLAALHAGMAEWRGKRRNINRISIGIALERTAPGATGAQYQALDNLVKQLRQQRDIPADAVVRWGDIAPRAAGGLRELPIERFRA